jgi:tetratricopeptide (TPR) repeat protein
VRAASGEIIVLKNGIAAKGKIVKAEEKGIRVEYSGARVVYHRREEVIEVQIENDPVLAEFNALRKKGDTVKAEDALRRAIAAQRIGWLAERYRVELMESQLADGRLAQAIATYLDIMRANPDSNRYARMPLPVYGHEENQAALRVLEKAAAGTAQAPPLLTRTLMGGLLAAEGRPKDAETYLSMVRAAGEAQAPYLAQILTAEIAIAQKKYREAWEGLEKAVRAMPEELLPRADFVLGVAYANGGEPQQAAVAFLRAPLMFQNESPAIQSECLYQGALCCDKAGLREQAAGLRRDLAQRFPSSCRARQSAGADKAGQKGVQN